jgi:hypothetical protein
MYAKTVKTNKHFCSRCGFVPCHQIARPSEGKAMGASVGLAVGGATKNIWAAIGVAVLGTIIGHMIDETVTPACPWCGDVLKVIASEIFSA